jgi:hypothetical protein
MPSRRDVVEWVGGRYPAPGDVVENGVRTRADIALWIVNPGGLIVAVDVGDSPLAPDTVAAALTKTLELPLPADRQFRVRVGDRALADALRAQLLDRVDVVVAPTPDLDAVAAQMQRDLGGGRRPPDRGCLHRGAIPADLVAWLFRAAADLWTVAPWRFASDDQVLALDVPALGVAGACVSIIGALGESFGFLVFASFDAYDAFAHQLPDDGPPPLDLHMRGLRASLNYARSADLSSVRKREIKQHGWRVAGRGANPVLMCAGDDGLPRDETADDVRLVAGCADALAAFCRRHERVFEIEPDRPLTETLHVRAPGGPMTVRLTARPTWQVSAVPPPPARHVGRNDPCPCGSGRKYKKCHLDADATAPSPPTRQQVLDLDRRMMRGLARFAQARHPELIERAEVACVGHPDFDVPWLVFHEPVEGRRLVDLYLDARRPTLEPAQRDWLIAQQATRLSIWEVSELAPDMSLVLRDVLTGETAHVADDLVTPRVRRGDRLLARVLRLSGVDIFSGLHPQPLRPSAAAAVGRVVRRRLGTRARIVDAAALRAPAVERVLLDAWEDACATELDRARHVTLNNTDGDPLLLTTDHFTLATADRAAVEAGLATITERTDDAGGASHFVLGGKDLVTIANIEVDDGAMRVLTNSQVRAEVVRTLVEGVCGDRVRHRVREHTDPRALLGRGDPPAAAPVPPEAAQLVLDFKRRHYATWPDERLPALDGLTPREAAARPAMRRRLTLLLDDMEHGEQSMPADQRFDFDTIRSALGLCPERPV